MIEKETITGIILAGGKSSRMGQDKGFLELKGTTFMSYIIDALEPIVSNIIIVSNNSAYDVFKLKRVQDVFPGSGPLAGLYSGLSHSETENNIVLSCDIPLIKKTVLSNLIKELDAKTDVVQIESRGKTMPLVAIYKKQCLYQFLTLLLNGERRLRVAVDQLKVKTIKLEPELEKCVRNINTIDELKEIRNELNY